MRWLSSLLGVFIFNVSTAQVDFSTIAFTNALQKAQSSGKIIFLQFEAANCNQCNDVANKGFENKELAEKLNNTFFCLKIDAHHSDRNKIATAYNINVDKGFGTLFIDNSGTVIHKFLKTTSSSREYLSQIDVALLKAGENIKIIELENEYKKGNRTFGFLQSLLQKRRSLNFPTDSLLDEYIEALPVDSLKSVYTLSFVAEMAPLLDSKADEALRKDPMAFNKAWYAMSLQKRISINNVIIYKSMSKAIKERDEKYAVRTASFAQGTNNNSSAGAKAYDKNLLRFYDETNDSLSYFRKSIAYFERYFLTVSPDSIKKMDSINVRRSIESGKKDTLREGNSIKISASIAYAPIAQNFARELNDGAYEFYKRTGNAYLLTIATEWAKRALQFYKTPQVLDTYAKLLYKQNQKEKAIEIMSEAISLQQQRGFPTKEFDLSLEQMKAGKPLHN